MPVTGWRGRPIAPGDLRHDANILTVLRWSLATAVVFSHSFVLTGAGPDPSEAVMPFPVSRLAVLLFFTLSGFLVTGSLVKRGVRQFAVARALRLFPGLWVMLVVSAAAVALWFSAVPFAQVAAEPEFKRYLVRNALLLSDAYTVPHVFAHNLIPDLINYSLWTLRHELRCYIALAVVGVIGLLAARRWLLALFVVAVVAQLLVPLDIVPSLKQPRSLAISFIAGVLFYLWRERVFLSWSAAIAAFVAALLIPHGEAARVAVALAGAYLALVVAFRGPAGWKRASAALPDYSYGIYIYAYPVQQAVLALGGSRSPYVNFVESLAITLLFAAASWHLVEKPALGLKARWMGPPTAPAQRADGSSPQPASAGVDRPGEEHVAL